MLKPFSGICTTVIFMKDKSHYKKADKSPEKFLFIVCDNKSIVIFLGVMCEKTKI